LPLSNVEARRTGSILFVSWLSEIEKRGEGEGTTGSHIFPLQSTCVDGDHMYNTVPPFRRRRRRLLRNDIK
jgi:hypothetical protein